MNRAGRDDRTLIRIAAMLVALAVLAERAAGRSLPVRWFVLCILRRAETVAHVFVMEAMPVDWPCLEEALEIETSPVDAAWLAWRLRLLAAILYALLRMDRSADRWNVAMDCPSRNHAPPLVLILCSGWTRRAYDTS
jgi:hypothetical protein